MAEPSEVGEAVIDPDDASSRIPPGFRHQPAVERALKFLREGLESGAFTARIDRVFEGLDQYAEAYRYLESNAQSWKIVITVR